MSKHLLDNLRKSVWEKAFPKTTMPSKWRNNHAKDLQNKLYRVLGTLLDTRVLLKFGGGKSIDAKTLNFLAKYALLEGKNKKNDNLSPAKTDYWQQFQNKVLGIEESPKVVEEDLQNPTPNGEKSDGKNEIDTNKKTTFPFPSTFYWRRKVDDELVELLQNHAAIWVEGASLTGKSRAVFEAFKKLSDREWVLTKVEDLQTAIEPSSASEDKKRLVVYVDNLWSYYEAYPHETWKVNQWLRHFLQAANTQLVVSNRTGLEARLMADYLPNDLLQKFTKIVVPSITFDDIEAFQMEVDVRLDFNAFDDSMGSLWMGFSSVQKKYEQLENIGDLGWNFSQKVTDTAQDILFALKHLDHVSHFHESPNCFKVSLIKDFCLRLQGRKISQKQWKEALNLLETLQQKTARFLDLPNANVLKVNRVYLDRAIEANLADSQIVRKIKELYTTAEQRIENSFFLHPAYFSKRIYAQQFFDQAKSLLEKAVEEGLQPNSAVLTSLLRKTPNFDQAFALLQQMKTWKVQPDSILFEVLLSKTGNYTQAEQVYLALKATQTPLNLTFFNQLMAKAENYQQVCDLMDDMEKAKVIPSIESFNALIARADDYSTVLQWVDRMKGVGCAPNLQTYFYWLQQSGDFEEAEQAWQEMKIAGFEPSTMEFYHLYLQRVKSLSKALELKKEVEENTTFSLGVEVFNVLLQLAENEVQVEAFREEMQELEILPTVATFNILIAQAVDFEGALKLLKEMPAFRLKASTDTYNALLQQAADLNAAIHVFEEMREQQVALNEESFLILLDKTEGFEEGLKLLIQLQHADYKAGKATFNRLIQRAQTIQPALQALRRMRQNGALPDVETYTLLIGKVNKGNFKQAFNLFKAMKSEYIRPTEECYRALLQKIAGYEQAFVNQVLRLYPQTLNDYDYHRIFAAILPEIDHHAFLKTAEEYIEKDERVKGLYGG